MYVNFCWLTNSGVPMCRYPLENIPYVFNPASPAVLSMSCSSYLDDLWNGSTTAVLWGAASRIYLEQHTIFSHKHTHTEISIYLSIYIYIYIYIYREREREREREIQVWAEKLIWSCDVCCWWLFWPMESKHSNVNEKNIYIMLEWKYILL